MTNGNYKYVKHDSLYYGRHWRTHTLQIFGRKMQAVMGSAYRYQRLTHMRSWQATIRSTLSPSTCSPTRAPSRQWSGWGYRHQRANIRETITNNNPMNIIAIRVLAHVLPWQAVIRSKLSPSTCTPCRQLSVRRYSHQSAPSREPLRGRDPVKIIAIRVLTHVRPWQVVIRSTLSPSTRSYTSAPSTYDENTREKN